VFCKFERYARLTQIVLLTRQPPDVILIDQHGGVSEVARKSGIPQPSLSRMLNSGSMSRRSTLYKIANALDLPEKDLVGDWVRAGGGCVGGRVRSRSRCRLAGRGPRA